MGTRINYEIMLDDRTGPAAILYSNSSCAEVDAEALFRQEIARCQGPTSLVEALLAYRYPASYRLPGARVFSIDVAPGDRLLVLRVDYSGPAPRVATLAG